jgi:RluA family pseudouridine synthase
LLKKEKVRNPSGALNRKDCVTAGEQILLPESSRLLELLSGRRGAKPKLEILYESREILIVNKPAGLAVHSSKGHEKDNLTERIGVLLTARGERFQFAPIHRLDLETSGPVLFGKGRKSCSELGQLFMREEVTKKYLALVIGKIAAKGNFLTDIPAKGKLKTAKTDYRTLAGNDAASLLELQLHTGRQHQIRRQLADVGHPLFGDRRYHGPCPKKLPRLFLHCWCLAFIDPFSKQQIAINCPLPKVLSKFLSQLGIEQ